MINYLVIVDIQYCLSVCVIVNRKHNSERRSSSKKPLAREFASTR